MAETEEVQDQEAAEQFFYTHGFYPTWYTGVRALSYSYSYPAYTAGVRALPAATYAYAGYPYAGYPYAAAYPYAYHPYAGYPFVAVKKAEEAKKDE